MRGLVQVLNWCDLSSTLSCVESLRSVVNHDVDILVIDNGSPDGSGESLRQELTKDIKFIQLNKNTGYTGGNNAGIKYACEHGYEWVLILNNDIKVVKETFVDEIEAVFSKSDIGAIGLEIGVYPEVENDNNKTRISGLGIIDKILDKIVSVKRKSTKIGEICVRTARSAPGSALALRISALEKTGGFDESFFMYAEEQDLCIRLIQAGYEVVLIEVKEPHVLRKKDIIEDKYLYWALGGRNTAWAYRRAFPLYISYPIVILQFAINFRNVLRYSLKKPNLLLLVISGFIKGLFFPVPKYGISNYKNCSRIDR